ncbi:MAG: glycosyltransferase [Acholeplasmataceae bacterium]|nr:glycosyltransferase [Acholeplasmataceae bacterium]
MTKKKILFISPEGLGKGGVQTIIMNLYRNLYEYYDFDILLFTNEIRYYDEEFSKNGLIYRYNLKRNRFFRQIFPFIYGLKIYKKTRNILTQKKYDIVHCFANYDNVWALKAAQKLKINKRIIHINSTKQIYNTKNPIKKIYTLYLIKMGRLTASIHLADSKKAAESYFQVKCKYEIVEPGFDYHKYQVSKWEKNDQKIRILQVGRFDENKNQLFSIKVFELLQNSNSNFLLTLVGSGPYEKKLKSYIKENNIRQIEFERFDIDLFSEYSKADILIFPSIEEAFGIVLLEAQSMGLTCFVSSSVSRSVNFGNCIYIDLHLGVEYWAKYIKEYVENNNLTKKPADLEKLSYENASLSFLDIYEKSS